MFSPFILPYTMIAAPLGRPSYIGFISSLFHAFDPVQRVLFVYTHIRMSAHHACNAYWSGVSEMGEEEGRDRTCFAADMRFVFAECLRRINKCVFTVLIWPVRRKWFCLHYGLKRLVKLAYSQHIIKYMIPLIGRLCILIAAANANTFSYTRGKRIREQQQQQQAAWLGSLFCYSLLVFFSFPKT